MNFNTFIKDIRGVYLLNYRTQVTYHRKGTSTHFKFSNNVHFVCTVNMLLWKKLVIINDVVYCEYKIIFKIYIVGKRTKGLHL